MGYRPPACSYLLRTLEYHTCSLSHAARQAVFYSLQQSQGDVQQAIRRQRQLTHQCLESVHISVHHIHVSAKCEKNCRVLEEPRRSLGGAWEEMGWTGLTPLSHLPVYCQQLMVNRQQFISIHKRLVFHAVSEDSRLSGANC